MNLDIPYYRLGEHEKVQFIPLKLALNDEINNNDVNISSSEKLIADENNPTFNNYSSNISMGFIILIGIVSLLVLFLLLYIIYYFVILRERERYLENVEEPSLVF
ncbi:AC78 [Parapoynx stagnalis nucleopolyhedrovirus]|uniref:AC78 n=1 Tax=Parapoynx stagnalis nucleopolyhedrovirus TaxID=2993413 RepID=A0A9E7Y6X8_9ABAC|nr:AC78 [Parapoynx stagnalis nucleopolyhedrovirus]